MKVETEGEMKRDINAIIKENEALLRQIKENKEKFWKAYGAADKKIQK